MIGCIKLLNQNGRKVFVVYVA